MCDRCSHSLFYAPDLNNSPCTDNPCTQGHLHGMAEPRNFRLCPSVCFCTITAPSAQGAPVTRLYSAKEKSPFRCTFFPPVSPHSCLVTCEAFSLASTPQTTREHISDTAVELLSCSFLPLGPPHQASVSRNHSVLSWSSSCVGTVTVEASSVLTAAASGL